MLSPSPEQAGVRLLAGKAPATAASLGALLFSAKASARPHEHMSVTGFEIYPCINYWVRWLASLPYELTSSKAQVTQLHPVPA